MQSMEVAKYYIHNHLKFTVKIHKDTLTDSARIVGFEVTSFSITHEYDGKWNQTTRLKTYDPHAARLFTSSLGPQEVEDMKKVIFTYTVEFEVIPFISCDELCLFFGKPEHTGESLDSIEMEKLGFVLLVLPEKELISMNLFYLENENLQVSCHDLRPPWIHLPFKPCWVKQANACPASPLGHHSYVVRTTGGGGGRS
ncbi:hypothetical protein LguiA_018795 [Lonicera macranthoides]